MKTTLIAISACLFLIFGFETNNNKFNNCQTLLKVSDSLVGKQKYIPIAHIDRIYDGRITRENLLKQEGISVFAYEKIEIISFEMIYWEISGKKVLETNSSLFTPEMNEIFAKYHLGNQIFFHQILAVNSKQDTILLNPIGIRVADKKHEGSRKIYNLTAYPEICGLYDGTITKKVLLDYPKITICYESWRIVRFQLETTGMGFGICEVCHSNLLSIAAKQVVADKKSGDKIYFTNITAVNSRNDTILLPMIFLTIK